MYPRAFGLCGAGRPDKARPDKARPPWRLDELLLVLGSLLSLLLLLLFAEVVAALLLLLAASAESDCVLESLDDRVSCSSAASCSTTNSSAVRPDLAIRCRRVLPAGMQCEGDES